MNLHSIEFGENKIDYESPKFYLNLFDIGLDIAKRHNQKRYPINSNVFRKSGYCLVEPYQLQYEALQPELPEFTGRNCSRLRMTFETPTGRSGVNLAPISSPRSNGISVGFISRTGSEQYRLISVDDQNTRNQIAHILGERLLSDIEPIQEVAA